MKIQQPRGVGLAGLVEMECDDPVLSLIVDRKEEWSRSRGGLHRF